MRNIGKVTRMLILYQRLFSGEKINKTTFCLEFEITKRSFDRDIEDIRLFLSESFSTNELLYNRKENYYELAKIRSGTLSGEEALILINMLCSSRILREDELEGILSSIISATESSRKKIVYKMAISQINKNLKTLPKVALLKLEWDIESCILNRNNIVISYEKSNGEVVERKVKPVEVIFDDGYAYLIAYRCDKEYEYPAFFRLDRINSFKIDNTYYLKELTEEYSKLDIKNYLKYMQAGALMNIKIRCKKEKRKLIEEGFKNVNLIEDNEDECILEIKCFEEGFLRWVMGQEDSMEVLEPIVLRNHIRNLIKKMGDMYREEVKVDG